jgi:hypothetical protein
MRQPRNAEVFNVAMSSLRFKEADFHGHSQVTDRFDPRIVGFRIVRLALVARTLRRQAFQLVNRFLTGQPAPPVWTHSAGIPPVI